MQLYNTLTRKIEPIQPLKPPAVGVYTCGPTVYDYAHIGHWFNYIRMDLLIRVLQINDLKPLWVMNITDVGHLVSDADEGEDKLEKGARREGKTAWEVADFYTKDFLECMHHLNILTPDHIVKATEHIEEQTELIKMLEQKGYTYVIDDGVYYDTSKFPGYAAFARLDLDDQQAGARVQYNTQKRSASDFALWKFSPKDHKRDMEWDSPWGKGFPGWHIECSAMSMKYLGSTLDIHTGGIDHIPVHHTNEIAQSEAATGVRFVNTWMHGNHVMVNDEKISKSLGNGIRLQEIISKGIPAEAVRLHVLESHYRSHSKFSWESLEAANNRLKSYHAMADQKWQTTDVGLINDNDIKNIQTAIQESLSNDLQTFDALRHLSALETTIDTGGINATSQDAFNAFLLWIDATLGLCLSTGSDITDKQKELLEQRGVSRKTKDWKTSDMIRATLLEEGIDIKDSATQQRWSKRF